MKKDKTHPKQQIIYSVIHLNKDGSFPNPPDRVKFIFLFFPNLFKVLQP